MPTTLEEIELAALQLDLHQRARLIEHLIASLDAEDEIQHAWCAEAAQRAAALAAGETAALPLEQTLAEIRATLQ